jgi:hypothetical protein
MHAVQAELAERSRKVIYVAAYAGIVGAASVVMNLGDAGSGEVPALGRVLLGLVGVAAAALLWTKPRIGWLIALAWAVVQIPYIAWTTDGSPTSQVLYLPLSVTSQNTVNGVVTSYSEFGVNLIGIVATIIIARWRADWLYRNR